MTSILNDVRISIRALSKNPGYALIAILALALGIGANTAIFSIVYSLIFRPMQGAQNPRELVSLVLFDEGYPYAPSYPAYEDYRSLKDVFADAAAITDETVQLQVGNQDPERIIMFEVTGNYFNMLGVQMAAGRAFTAEEGTRVGAGNVAVLSYSYWQKRFHSDRNVIGSVIKMNENAFTIVGIASREFSENSALLAQTLYIPLTGADLLYPNNWANIQKRLRAGGLNFIGRLRQGVTLEQARTAVSLEAARLAQQYPEIHKGQKALLYPEPRTRLEAAAASFMPPVAMVFMSLVGLVLLAACANVASLFYARASGRQKELAIRVALGARRTRILRDLLTESLLLSLAGGLAGLVLSRWIVKLLASIRFATDLQLDFHFALDLTVMGYALLLAVASGLIAGVMPGLRISVKNLASTLREGGQTSLRGSVKQRLRDVLVVLQVAVTLVLLVCAGLFLRSSLNVAKQDVGIRTDNLIVMSMDPEMLNYKQDRSIVFYRNLLDRVRALPGVDSAALGRYLPIGFQNGMYEVFIEGAASNPEQPKNSFFNIVSQDYFSTVGVRPIQGRLFNSSDKEGSKLVAVINQAMADRYWPGQNPLGKRFRFREKNQQPVEVIGIVKTGKYVLPAERPTPSFYLPFEQNFRSDMVLHVHTQRDPKQLIGTVRNVIRQIDPQMPVWDMRTMDEHIRYGKMRLYDIGTGLIGGFGLIALMLAAVGLYGVMSFLVNLRTQEIGVRIALGATQSNVLKAVLGTGTRKTLIGMLLGVPLTILATSAVRYMLVGISPRDPLTLVAAGLFIAVVSFFSTVAPAWRASCLDPMIALRNE